jgi:hypothetical protein
MIVYCIVVASCCHSYQQMCFVASRILTCVWGVGILALFTSIIAQERLDRITECVNEMSLAEQVPPMVKVGSKNISRGGSPAVDDPDGWMESAIPVDSVLGATAAAAGLISESEMSSFSLRVSGHMSPDTASELASPQSLTPLAQTQREACVGEGVHGEADQGSLSISRSQGGMEVQF